MAALDIDGNGLDDVVVGAPLFVHDRGDVAGRLPVDQGRIAVYLNDHRWVLFEYPHTKE